jgi:hypothetical protein
VDLRGSLNGPGKRCPCKLPGCIDDLVPDRHAVCITSRRELGGRYGAFNLGRVAVTLEHQVRDAPDVDLRYHAANGRRGSPRKV